MRMRSELSWIVLPLALLAGCQESSGGSTPAPSASTPPAAASVAIVEAGPPAKPKPMIGRHGGLAASLFRAAADGNLSDAQKDQLTDIEKSLKADDDGIRTAMKQVRTDLLAGVKAGKIDTAKMTADDAVVDKAISDHQDKEAAALDKLHALLDMGQRTAVVNTVKAKQAERETHMTGWLQAKEADGGATDWNKKRLDRLTADLALDAGQQKQVSAIFTKLTDPPNQAGMQQRWDEHKKRVDALLAAFASDTFDAKKSDLQMLPGKTAHDPFEHSVAFFTQLLPILHPDQRDKLATPDGPPLRRPRGHGWSWWSRRTGRSGDAGHAAPPGRRHLFPVRGTERGLGRRRRGAAEVDGARDHGHGGVG
jgi:hypothetical protein